MEKTITTMPALFVGHGSPMNLIANNEFTIGLRELSKELPHPKAICVISSHWLTSGTRICCNSFPRQIYDFYGFPEDLYEIIHEPVGASELAVTTSELLGGGNNGVQCNNTDVGDVGWGNDHAAWSVLHHLYPKADIPTFYISVDMDADLKKHADLGQRLSTLRRKGVLIIGSGNVVHNLSDVDMANQKAEPNKLGLEFDCFIKKVLEENDIDGLINYQQQGLAAKYSVPTKDHFLPLIWIAGLRESDDGISFPCEIFQNRSISMRSVLIG